MNTTFRIAKLELNTLFYSPIAWFLSIVFIFQCGLAYTNVLQNYLTFQEHGGEQIKFLYFLTNTTFGYQGGLYGNVLTKIYLYLPLLTMGLISREISSGTIKLLYSSPVKVKEIVFGKFAAMMVYNLLLILILLVFVFCGMANIQSADPGFLFPPLVGIYLLLCTYAAIGLFMSSLTSYQVVAAISTLVIFAVLAYVGSVWQDVDFVRDLTYFLAVNGRAEHMLYGIISSKDVLYFVIIIVMFLAFTVLKLKSGRESKSPLQVAGAYALIFFTALIAGYLSSIPGYIGYIDATSGKYQTITATTQKVLKELGDEPLEITSYINLLDGLYYTGKPDQRNRDKDRWERYLRFKPNIKFNYVYYYDMPAPEQNLAEQYPGKTIKEIAEQIAASQKTSLGNFLTPDEIRKVIDLGPEKNRYVMQLKYKGKQTFLRLFEDQEVFPSETEVSAALKRLMVPLPKIVFLQGQYERSKDKLGDKDYGIQTSLIKNRTALVNQGFDTDTINLRDKEVPENISALVIADPRTAFSGAVLKKIQQYIADGGNLLIAGEPGKQDVLNPILQPLGVTMMQGMLVQKSKDFGPDLIRALLSPKAANLSKDLQSDFKDSIGVSMPGAVGLAISASSPFKIEALLQTDEKVSWIKKAKLVLDSATVEYSKAEGDLQVSVPTMLSLTRNINGKEQRIVVSGDADFLSSAELKRWGTANRDFNTPLMGWFTYGQFPIDTSRPGSKDNRLNLNYAGITTLKVGLMGVLPGLVLAFATIFLIRRKRK